MNKIQSHQRFVFNDGANGYFERILDSTNYNRVVAYKGLNDNYISEIPSINLIKSHGSVNWKRYKDSVFVLNQVCDSPMIVPPTGYEAQETFLNNYFHDMLRVFQLELDKPQSVLLVIGFSFQDQHIARMIKRALQNPELIIYVFIYRGEGNEIKNNLSMDNIPSNLKFVTTKSIYTKDYINFLSEIKILISSMPEIVKKLTEMRENIEFSGILGVEDEYLKKMLPFIERTIDDILELWFVKKLILIENKELEEKKDYLDYVVSKYNSNYMELIELYDIMYARFKELKSFLKSINEVISKDNENGLLSVVEEMESYIGSIELKKRDTYPYTNISFTLDNLSEILSNPEIDMPTKVDNWHEK